MAKFSRFFQVKFNKKMVSNVITGMMMQKKTKNISLKDRVNKRLDFNQKLANFAFNSLRGVAF